MNTYTALLALLTIIIAGVALFGDGDPAVLWPLAALGAMLTLASAGIVSALREGK